jgi:hypothetical protein
VRIAFAAAWPGATLHQEGSSSITVDVSCSERNHSGSEQIDACSAVHVALQGFQPVDLALRLPVAPALSDSVPDRGEILPRLDGELA